MLFGNTDEDIGREEAVVHALVERKIDGLLLCPARGSHAYLKRYLARRLPVVAVNRCLDRLAVPAVTADNEQAALEATAHLLARGLVPVAVILGTPGLSTTAGRLRGCRRAVAAAGFPSTTLRTAVGHGRTEPGYKAALECLDACPRPRAILAFNNLMAEAALMAIHARGLRCPEDVALVGFDDFRSAAALTPPLTVVEQDPEGMGARAVAELGKLLDGTPGGRHVRLPARLVLRASTIIRMPVEGT